MPNNFTKENIARWAISSGITFAAGMAVVILANYDSVTLESFRDGSILGLLFLAARAGVKGIVEAFMVWYSTR